MDRGEHYECNRHSERSNRTEDYTPHFSHNRPSRFPDHRSSNSQFGYGHNRQNLFPRNNRRENKTYVEPTDYLDFKKHKKNEQPSKFDYKLDQFEQQKQQNCRSVNSYRSEIRKRQCGGHYPEYRTNFDNMDERIMEYWNNRGRQNEEETASNKVGERQRRDVDIVSLRKEKERTDTKKRREDRLEEIVQLVESVSKTNIIKEGERQMMSRCEQHPSQSFTEGIENQQGEENQQDESSSWINQEDILQDLSKSSLNDCSRKQQVSVIEKQQQDKNPSYLSSIEGHSSSGENQTFSGLGHDLKVKRVNLNIHKLLQEEGEQQLQKQQQEREDVPELSIIPKEQILSKIQLASSLEQKDIEIEFICRKNIVQLKIKEVYLVKLQLTAKLIQDRDGDITMVTNPSIDQEVLQQYIRFYQISQALPRIFQSEATKVNFKFCNIRVPPREEPKLQRPKELSFIKKRNHPQTDKNNLILDWQLIRIQKMQLHCMSCNRSNVVPIIHGDLSASLSCKECSESMELQIVKVSSE